jgi:hypothetical protein
VFTVPDMTSIARWVRSFGNAGAVKNAWRSCEERRLTEQRVQALSNRLAGTRNVPEWPKTAIGG